MLIVTSATLTSFNRSNDNRERNAKLNDLQETSRRTEDRLAVQLRNLANPSNTILNTIDTAQSYDVIFQTTDPSKRWVRYCLATSGTFSGKTASTDNGILYQQTAGTGVTSISNAMKSACPSTDSNWASTSVQTTNVTNRRASLNRPVFTYDVCTDASTGTVTDPCTLLSRIQNIDANLWVDNDTSRVPKEVNIASGVYLRNQNQAPTASFNATRATSGSNAQRTFLLNGTQSSDPEGRALQMLWYKGPSGATLTNGDLPDCVSATTNTVSGQTWTCIGPSALLNYTFPASDGNSQVAYLVVTDAGGLQALCSATLTLNSSTPAQVNCP
jgi:hypothetical protein